MYRYPGWGAEQQERQQWQRFRLNADRVNAYASTPDTPSSINAQDRFHPSSLRLFS